MGNEYQIQACLRTDELLGEPELGKEYSFEKEGHRIYQIEVPMDLRKNNWDFVCRIIITEIIIGNGKTKGTFIPVKLFNKEEREIITKTYISTEEAKSIAK